MKPNRFIFLCLVLASCVIHHDQRRLVSRNKSQLPVWIELPQAKWRQDLDQEVFLYHGKSVAILPQAMKDIETQASQDAVGQLRSWMHDRLVRHGLLDALDAEENSKLIQMVGDISDKEFERYTHIRDIYFEEYAIITATSTSHEVSAYVLLGLPFEARNIAFNRLAMRLREEKSSKFQQLAQRIDRSFEVLVKSVAH